MKDLGIKNSTSYTGLSTRATNTSRKSKGDKISIKEFPSTPQKSASKSKLNFQASSNRSDRFSNYKDGLYNSLIKITNVVGIQSPIKHDRFSEKINSNPIAYYNTNIKPNVNTSNEKFRRFKKSYIKFEYEPGINESKISRLTSSINNLSKGDVGQIVKTLISNDIDPDTKQVQKILSEVDTGGKNTKALSKLNKIKNISVIEKLEDKILVEAQKQTLTSFASQSSLNSKKLVVDTYGFGNTKKRSFSSMDENVAHQTVSKVTIKHSTKPIEQMKRNYSQGLQKKVEFTYSSEVFTKPLKTDASSVSLSKKYEKSIQQLTTSNVTLKNFKEKSKLELEPEIISMKHGIKNKNVVSSENIAVVTDKKQFKELTKDAPKIKIVGLLGRGKNSDTNREVNQNNSSYDNLFKWDTKKIISIKSNGIPSQVNEFKVPRDNQSIAVAKELGFLKLLSK